jgi:tetratricopeptide (TPR) repeat protein
LPILIAALASILFAPPQAANSQQNVRALAEQAQTEQRSGDFAGAERDYRAALALAPNFAELHMNLGLVYQLQQRLPDAMVEFRRALVIKPALAGANFFLGVDYCRAGKGAEAIPYLRSALKSQPERKDIWFWLATAQEMAGDSRAELATLQRALALYPDDADLLYQLGHAYEQLGKDEVSYIQKSAPGSFRAEELLGESYASSGEWPLAVLHFQNAIAAAPEARGLHYQAGEVYLRAGNSAKAIEQFDAELKLDPHSLRAATRRGECELISGEVTPAIEDFDAAVATDALQAQRILGIGSAGSSSPAIEQLPEAQRAALSKLVPRISSQAGGGATLALEFIGAQKGDASPAGQHDLSSEPASCSPSEFRNALSEERYSAVSACASHSLDAHTPVSLRVAAGAALVEANDCKAALAALASLPPSMGHSPDVSYWRARCYEKLGAQAYLTLYEKNPDSYRSHQVAGDIAAAKGDDVKAIQEYRAALALKPALPGLHFSLGHILWKNLKVPEAREQLEAELAINPRHPGALEDLADTYLLEHQPGRALPYLQRALAVDGNNLDVHRDLGTAYSELNENQKAAEELKIALPSDHDGSIHYKLARVYQALGKKDEAALEFAASGNLNRESHEKLERQTDRLAEIEKSTQKP